MTSLAFFADENVIVPAHAALASTLTHWSGPQALDVHLFHSGWSAHDLRLLSSTADMRGNCRLHTHAFDTRRVAHWNPLYGTHMPYGRLFLPDLLPGESDLIYMDVDTIVEIDLQDVIAGTPQGGGVAAMEAWDFGHSHDAALACELGIDASSPYFNSSLLLMDLEWCREIDFVAQCLRFGDRHAQRLKSHDQTILNFILFGRLGRIPPRFTSLLYPTGPQAAKKGIHSLCGSPKPFDPFGNVLNLHFAAFDTWIQRSALAGWSPNAPRNVMRWRRNVRLLRPMVRSALARLKGSGA